MAELGTDLQIAAELLINNALVAIPTETVYGLAANALNTDAITKIFEAKNRPFFDPLIIHTSSLEKINHLVKSIPSVFLEMANDLMPGPLTILLEKNDLIPDIVTAGSEKVAVRIPDHPLTLKLLEALDFPLAAPSANPFGYISPTSAHHVIDQLGEKIAYVLDGGNCKVGLESTILDWKEGKLFVLRKGGVPIEVLSKYADDIVVTEHSSSNPTAPGMLKSHYSPRVPVMINPSVEALERYNLERIGVLAFRHSKEIIPLENQLILSKEGDLHEAARNLFSYMRILDGMDIDLIITEVFPEVGLGRAINDKLRRAATQ